MTKRKPRRSKVAGDGHPSAWLNLVPNSGPFLSPPVLKAAFPNGLEKQADESAHVADLRVAYEEWQAAVESAGNSDFHPAWIRWVLRETLGFTGEVLRGAGSLPDGTTVRIAEHHETLSPDFALVEPEGAEKAGRPRFLIRVVPAGQDLEKPEAGKRWKASPSTRITELIRGSDHGALVLGLVTNGDDWMLVHAPRGETPSFGTWKAWLWQEERDTLRAFRSLLSAERFFGDPDGTLESLFARSAKDQFELTDRLGYQVRRAVEILVTTIDRIDRDRNRKLLAGFDVKRLYEASVTVMMRLVFLLYAEEHHLLPVGNRFYEQHYAVSTLLNQLQESEDRLGAQVLARRPSAWARLLATFRAVHSGAGHDEFCLPPYGGSLFDPDRFPFLEGRERGTRWHEAVARPLPIDDRTVLELLRSLQYLGVRAGGVGQTEARRLSFKGLGVEQIGHVYESLLDHTAIRADGPVLGLVGAGHREPEVAVEELEQQRGVGDEALIRWLKARTGKQPQTIKRSLQYEIPKEDADRWAVRCGHDKSLLYRVRPWAGLVRFDEQGDPVVIEPGSVYVTQGSDRRSTGTHYTPPSLTEPIVKYALTPLVYHGPSDGKPEDQWTLKPPAEILKLKVCDLAMGSAAFLVQACRFLSERLVEAWEELERANPGKVLVTPEGGLAEGKASESPIPLNPEERLAVARRFVSDRCLYGVDRDPMAVEMAKLSLWLVTLQKGKPFTFLNHALKPGDSLLGVTSAKQLTSFHPTPEKSRTVPLFSQELRTALATAVGRRRKLEAHRVDDLRDAEQKERLLKEAEAATSELRVLADLLTGAAISTVQAADSQFEDLRSDSLARASTALSGEGAERGRLVAELDEDARRMLDDGKPESLPTRCPLHWPLAFPEVFLVPDEQEHIGFNAFIGNPPFAGGTLISGREGKDFQSFLTKYLAIGDGAGGRADLSAYFYLRAFKLLADGATFGLLATNSIGQGDTREVGLERMVEKGFTIFRAVKDMVWPGTANLHVSIVWGRKGEWNGTRIVDGEICDEVPPSLDPFAMLPEKRHILATNRGRASEGVKTMGEGFVLTPDEARALLRENPRNGDVIRPFLGGVDLTSHPKQKPSRFVIHFQNWPLERARDYPTCFRILEERVKPDRATKAEDVAAWPWWRFWRDRKAFFDRTADLRQILVTPQTRKHHVFDFMNKGIVPQNSLTMIAADDYGSFALMSSSVHRVWIEATCSTLKSDQSYRISDGFNTFPWPESTDTCREAGQCYYEYRASLFQEFNEGLTDLYNRFDDPENDDARINRLRELHADIDRAVLHSYGWSNVNLDHDFRPFKDGIAYIVSTRVRGQFLSKLWELNAAIHEAEKSCSAQKPVRTRKREPRARRRSPRSSARERTLFESESAGTDQVDPSRAILEFLRATGVPASKSEIITATGIDPSGWSRIIRNLTGEGVVRQQGTRRGAKYAAVRTARHK